MTMTEHPDSAPSGGGNANLAAALLVLFGGGVFWLFALYGIGVAFGVRAAGVIWVVCAGVLWIPETFRMAGARDEPGAVWWLTFRWWLKSFVAPAFLLAEVLSWRLLPSTAPAAQPHRLEPDAWARPAEPNGTSRRLDDFAQRLAALERELADLRLAAEATAEPAPAPVLREPTPEPAAPVVVPSRPPVPAPRPPEPATPPWWSGLTFADLFSARVLAWVGGVVTLLGILFFFVLAVNRGWIGPVARVSLGAIASALVFSGGLTLRRRFGHLYYSAYGAAGAGIAGGYGTLLAATLRYHLLSDWAAVLVAAAIGATAVATALAWSSELIAGLGLVGATLAPAAVGLQNGELSAAGTGFAALVFAGTVIVAVRKKWQSLLLVGVAATLPQAAVLVAQGHGTDWGSVAAAAAVWLLLLAAASALQLRLQTADLAPLPTGLVLVSASFAGAAAAAQFGGTGLGTALVAAAGVYALAAALHFPRRRERDLSALLGAVGLALMAIGVAELISGPALAIAWAAEAAGLAWLARRIGEFRYQLASVAYLAAALVHALALDAPLHRLYRASAHPASGALALLLVALAGAVVAFYARPWPAPEARGGFLAPLDVILDELRSRQTLWRSAVGWTSAVAALYVASLAILDLAQRLGTGTQVPFEWGQVAVVGLWGVVALAVLQTGSTRSWRQFRVAGLVWLGVVLAQLGLFVSTQLSGDRRGFAFLVAAAALLAGSLFDRLQRPEKAALPLIGTYAVASLAVAVTGLVLLVGGRTAEGLSLLALSGFYCGIAALVFGRDRELATLLWAPALGVALVAFAEPLSGTWLVLAWTATGAALAAAADRTPERRLQVAALGYVAAALAHAVWLEAPPSNFFESSTHPASGVPAVLFVVLAAALLVLLARTHGGSGDAFDRAVAAKQRALQRTGLVVGAVLGLYAVSLSILGLAEEIGSGSTIDRFHGGHAAVSAVWGVLGLVALYVGLSRRLGWLQALGFGLFAVSLAKIFLYDLTFLSSIARALSFLAVGAVLLLGGFFVQKLGAQRRGA